MPASRRSGKSERVTGRIVKTLPKLMHEVIKVAARLAFLARANRNQNCGLTGLHGLNDHLLRDVGLLRDRDSGLILNDIDGEIVFPVVKPGPFVKPDGQGQGFRNDGNDRRRQGSDRRMEERRGGDHRDFENARMGFRSAICGISGPGLP